jgi:hypothetical protein
MLELSSARNVLQVLKQIVIYHVTNIQLTAMLGHLHVRSAVKRSKQKMMLDHTRIFIKWNLISNVDTAIRSSKQS